MSVSAPVTIMPLEVVAPYTDARDAYQLALAEGFEGTREEWLASLIGPATGIAVGTVESAEFGEEPSATITGTAPNLVLNLKLPVADYKGPFPDDESARRGNVALNETYKLPNGALAYRRKGQVPRMSVGGDSISVALASGLYKTKPDGFASWLRIFSGSAFDFAPSGSSLAHGAGGITSSQFVASHLAGQIAAGAPVDFFRVGTNDPPNLIPIATTVANLKACCDASRAAGHIPVVGSIFPCPLSFAGNGAGAISADYVQRNAALQAMCVENKHHWIDGTGPMCTVPGNMILQEQYASAPGNNHPGMLGCYTWALQELPQLQAILDFLINPRTLSSNYITANTSFAAGTNRPTGYNAYFSGDNVTESIYTDSDGVKWWQIQLNSKSGGEWLLWNDTAIASPVGKIVDFLAEVKVVQGNFRALNTRLRNQAGTALAEELFPANLTALPVRDLFTLRTTMPYTVPGGTTLVDPCIYIQPVESTGCVLRIRQGFGVRQLS